MKGALVPSSVEELDAYEDSQMELCPDYWTASEVGESRKAYFMGIEEHTFPDPNDADKHHEIPCALFCRRVNGVVEVFANASKRLMAIMEKQEEGKPFIITYTGKKQNSSNQKQSDSWSIRPLLRKGAES